MKYEEVLIEDYEKLDLIRKDLDVSIREASIRVNKILDIEQKMNNLGRMPFRLLFMWGKVKQFIRIEKRVYSRLAKLVKEFLKVDIRIKEIRNDLTKYYDNQIKESVGSLGIEGVEKLQDLLILTNDTRFKKFDSDLSGH